MIIVLKSRNIELDYPTKKKYQISCPQMPVRNLNTM